MAWLFENWIVIDPDQSHGLSYKLWITLARQKFSGLITAIGCCWSITVHLLALCASMLCVFRGQIRSVFDCCSRIRKNMATKTKNMLKVGMQSVKLNCWNRVQQIDGPEDSGQVKLGRHKALLWLISIQKMVVMCFFLFTSGVDTTRLENNNEVQIAVLTPAVLYHCEQVRLAGQQTRGFWPGRWGVGGPLFA